MAKKPQLTTRSIEIFRELVDAYLETGEAVGSRLLAKKSSYALSSATIRNIMADLEDLGLLYAPHTSAGRIPTEAGFSFFVNSLLECSDFTDFEDETIEQALSESKKSGINAVLEKASSLLSGLSKYAGIVLTPQSNPTLQRIEFIALSDSQILVIMISDTGHIENRIIQSPNQQPICELTELSNYLSHYLEGKTVTEGIDWLQKELIANRSNFDTLAAHILQQSLKSLSHKNKNDFVFKGQANLLDHIEELGELEHIRQLFEAIETKETMVKLLDSTAKAQGVQVFIGAEHKDFNLAGCSLIASSYHSPKNKIVGAIGIIGPTNMNYRHIIPLVNCTSKIINRLLRDEPDI